MNKRISDMMSDIDINLIEGIHLQENIKTEEISFSHIKDLAMQGIEAKQSHSSSKTDSLTRVYDLKDKQKEQKKRKSTMKRIILPLVAAVCLLVGGVVAIQYNPILKNTFGKFFPFEEQVQPIEKSMTSKGYIFTAEGAFIGKKQGLFITSLKKVDGTPFEENTQIDSMQLQMKGPVGMGWHVNHILSEDKTELISIVDLEASKNLYGKDLVLKANNLSKKNSYEYLLTIPLDQVIQKSTVKKIEYPWNQYQSKEKLKQTPVKELPEITLDSITSTDKGLEIVTSYKDLEGIQDRTIDLFLVDERTQKVYEGDISERKWSEEEQLNKNYSLFKNVKQEDIPYLKIKVQDHYDKNLIKNEWQVEFKLDKNTQIKTKKVNTLIKTDTQKLKLKKIELSALGVTVEGTKRSRYNENLEAYLEMKDGSVINLWNSGMSSNGFSFVMNYQVSGGYFINNNLPQFIDINKVKSIVIAGQRYKF